MIKGLVWKGCTGGGGEKREAVVVVVVAATLDDLLQVSNRVTRYGSIVQLDVW